MDNQLPAYGNLCSLFYDATKKYASTREVDFYAQFMDPGKRTLEAMCGSGRLLIPLMERGYTVDGVDNSPSMLARCRERCAQKGLAPELYQQSLEQLDLRHNYATVTIAVASFQLIVDRASAVQALKNLRTVMEPGGSLLIDTFVPDLTADARSVRDARLDARTVIRLTTRYLFDEAQKIADGYCSYELLIDGSMEQQEEELIRLTWYTDEQFIELLQDGGFEFVAVYDELLRSTGPSRIFHARVGLHL